MRELSIVDMNLVSGGLSEADAVAIGSGLGGGIALSLAMQFGLTATQSLTLAGLGAAGGAALTAAGIAGWAIGKGLNEHTPIQSWIASTLDAINQGLDGDE